MVSVETREAVARAREVVGRIPDPEIPVVTIEELGVLRDVRIEDGTVVVVVTPTYSGCPAMDAITVDIEAILREAGFTSVRVETVYSPAWTTDWIGPAARRKLAEFGIAPPQPAAADRGPIVCPRCRSDETRLVSEFGSTACKAFVVCESCREPFDYFKEL